MNGSSLDHWERFKGVSCVNAIGNVEIDMKTFYLPSISKELLSNNELMPREEKIWLGRFLGLKSMSQLDPHFPALELHYWEQDSDSKIFVELSNYDS